MEDLFYFCHVANFILYDPPGYEKMYPFTLTRSVADCRIGILTIREKWEKALNEKTGTLAPAPLKSLYPLKKGADNYWIHSGLLPDKEIVKALKSLPGETALVSNDHLLMSRSSAISLGGDVSTIKYDKDYLLMEYPWELFQNNGKVLREDFDLLTRQRTSKRLGPDVELIKTEDIFIEESASVTCATINASAGPVYIGKHAIVMGGSHLYGPVAIGDEAIVKMGAKIYGATTVGPHSMAGGEIKNSIFFDHSNKAHEGYLGDAVLGAWCNLGAGTTCSNLKNTAGTIKIRQGGALIEVGQKCGMMMGDFSRTAVQTRINSGTMIGVSAHISEVDFPPKNVPSFYWSGDERYRIDKALQHADNWMHLKDQSLSKEMQDVLTRIYEKGK